MIASSIARLRVARMWFGRTIVGQDFDETLLGVTPEWLQSKTPKDGLSVQYLFSIANVRFGLVNAAKWVYTLFSQDEYDEDESTKVCNKSLDTFLPACLHSITDMHLYIFYYLLFIYF